MKVINDRGSEKWMDGWRKSRPCLVFHHCKRWAREFITAGVNEVKVKNQQQQKKTTDLVEEEAG
jgi:hypothetical protein